MFFMNQLVLTAKRQTVKKYVLVVNDFADCGFSYGTPLDFIGPCTNDMNLLDESPECIAALVFTGGADINPNIYGQEAILETYCNDHRDLVELVAYEKGNDNNIPMIGICRGAQLLCALEGGYLIQHVTGHHGRHTVTTNDGKQLLVNSVHHQMMVPSEKATLLAWADPKLSKYYITEGDEPVSIDLETEAVYWPSINALGVQYHPEALPVNSDGARYFREIIIKYLL